ncbi:MAG: potassium-transporting ATPase subunit KdpC [Chlamydiae bacterium]|nr:potassium-transporting ATPase subunit KdpC [Chlamydiota bacterium]
MKHFIHEHVIPSIKILLFLTLLIGIIYPLFIRGIAVVLFKDQSEGSLIKNKEGKFVGSKLIGQNFSSLKYFHPRISYAGAYGYDGCDSNGSSLGPSSKILLNVISTECEKYRKLNGLGQSIPIPADAVTSSASGLDPHISTENARLQCDRIAKERNVTKEEIFRIVENYSHSSWISGFSHVNVLELNIALDEQFSNNSTIGIQPKN